MGFLKFFASGLGKKGKVRKRKTGPVKKFGKKRPDFRVTVLNDEKGKGPKSIIA